MGGDQPDRYLGEQQGEQRGCGFVLADLLACASCTSQSKPLDRAVEEEDDDRPPPLDKSLTGG